LVLLDPPYKLEELDEVLGAMASTPNLIDEGGMVVAGHSRHLELKAEYFPLHRVSQRRYGDNAVDFYLNEAESE
jgi:16S rRNA G966 N2-methylase RsmD